MEYRAFYVYRGLQKPLEFMGLKGRYVYVGAGTILGSILLFIVSYLLLDFLPALILTSITLISGAVWVVRKQKKGLHTKPTLQGTYYITHLIKIDK